mgnify:CR=1 FL=1
MTNPNSRKTVNEWEATLLSTLLVHPYRHSDPSSRRKALKDVDDLQESSPNRSIDENAASLGPVTGLYIISVAARLTEMHPQTLRKYERAGLVQPSRTVGMLRLYSEEDIIKLRLIKHLVGDLGLNLAGVEIALGIFQQIMKMKKSIQTGDGKDELLDECLNEMLAVLRVRIN